MLPGKSRPKIRRLSRGHHSAFIHQHLTPSTQPPSMVHPSAHSFIYLPIQPSNCLPVYSSVQTSIFSIYPFIQSTDPSFHSSTVYPFVHHLSTQIVSIYAIPSLLAFTLIPESPGELFTQGREEGATQVILTPASYFLRITLTWRVSSF